MKHLFQTPVCLRIGEVQTGMATDISRIFELPLLNVTPTLQRLNINFKLEFWFEIGCWGGACMVGL